jgi:NADPH:quinone reductase-like Zn-dependent oxidoreductase
MPTNTVAWLTARATPLEVKPAPYEPPRENEIVIKTAAVAINPVDWVIQLRGESLFPRITYPCILGEDVASEVVEVGSGVSRFKVGDRVLGLAVAIRENTASSGAFQNYTVLLAQIASPIPDALSYESAAVLPLGLSTAACGLFQKDYLALQYPSVDPKPTGKALLIWGGSTSVGSNAIQLAIAAGYEVITTASPKNFSYVTALGASQAFDYNSATVIEDIIAALKGKTIAGAMAIGSALAPGNGAAAADACLKIVDKSEGTKFVAMALRFSEKPPEGVNAKFILGSELKGNEVGKVIYEDFLPKALAEGKYIATPDPLIVGKGLEYVQAGFDLQKKGVSARKVVVSL